MTRSLLVYFILPSFTAAAASCCLYLLSRDCRDEEEAEPRVWSNFHEDDILSAAMYPTGLVATSAYDGVVKVWNIESGHVNCKLNADNYGLETTRSLIPADVKRQVSLSNAVIEAVNTFKEQMHRNKSFDAGKKNHRSTVITPGLRPKIEAFEKEKSLLPDLTKVQFLSSYHDSSVDKVLFLERRKNSFSTATLMTTGSGGSIRAWSVTGGGLLGHFTAAQGPHESVLSMTTDHNNTILVTGDTAGFVKVWEISLYCINSSEQKPTCALLLRKLPSVNRRHSTKLGTIDTKPPPLLVTFRAHLKPIVSLDFVDSRQFIISASTDASVRLWTQTGRYIGTFGQRELWNLEKAVKEKRKLPPDIYRIASAETLRNLHSSPGPKWRLARHIMRITAMTRRGTQHNTQDAIDNTDDEKEWDTTITRSLENVLGKFYKPKTRHRFLPPLPRLKFNQDQMTVYSSLNFKDLQAIEEPKTPAVLWNHATRCKSSSALLPRVIKVAGHRRSSEAKHTSYYNASVKQHRSNQIPATKSASRKPNDWLMRSSLKK